MFQPITIFFNIGIIEYKCVIRSTFILIIGQLQTLY